MRNCDKELVAIFHLSDNKPFTFLPPFPTIIYILPKCIHSSQSHQNSPPITESGLKSKLTPSKSDSQIPFCVYLSQYEDLQTKGPSDLSHLLTYQTYNVNTQSSGAAVNTDFEKEWGNGKHITVVYCNSEIQLRKCCQFSDQNLLLNPKMVLTGFNNTLWVFGSTFSTAFILTRNGRCLKLSNFLCLLPANSNQNHKASFCVCFFFFLFWNSIHSF